MAARLALERALEQSRKQEAVIRAADDREHLRCHQSAAERVSGARGPVQYLDFPSTASFVSARVGSGPDGGFPLSMEAYNANQQLLDSDSVILTPAMQTLSVSGSGISRVVVGVMGPCIWVLDDLCFDHGATPVENTTWGSVKSFFK